MNKKAEVDDLREWRLRTLREMEEAKVELQHLQRRLGRSQERLELLDRLLALEAGDAPEPVQSPSSPGDFLAACERILGEAGRPMHIRDIHAALIDDRVPIPGRGSQANVIARLQRSDGRVIRTGRGMYGLPEFGYSEVKPTRRRHRSSTK